MATFRKLKTARARRCEPRFGNLKEIILCHFVITQPRGKKIYTYETLDKKCQKYRKKYDEQRRST